MQQNECHLECEKQISELKAQIRSLSECTKVVSRPIRYKSSESLKSLCSSTFSFKTETNGEKALNRSRQPTAPPEEPALMAPMQVKEVFWTAPQGDHQLGSIEMAIVPLIAEQVRAVGKQIGLLKKETAIAWLAQLAILRENIRYAISDLIVIVQECIDS